MEQERKPKRVSILFFDNQIVMECPFCGRTLIKTDYERMRKLLQEKTPRGKACEKCGGVAILNLNTQAKKIVIAKLSQEDGVAQASSVEKGQG
jgi:uncharacterized Zn finger protein